jgi:hypothetical protein
MFEQTKLINVRAESVQLEAPLVGYRLRFQLELQLLAHPDPALTEIRLPAEAHVTRPGASTSPRLVGPLHLDKFGMIIPPSSPGARLTEYATVELPGVAAEYENGLGHVQLPGSAARAAVRFLPLELSSEGLGLGVRFDAEFLVEPRFEFPIAGESGGSAAE